MSVAVVWGWYGVGGAVAMLMLGLLAAFAVLWNLDDASAGQPWRARLRASRRGALAVLFAVLLLGASAVSFVGAFSEHTIQFTVKTLRTEYDRGGESYEVDDTEGHTFVVQRDDWDKLHEREAVECRVATPPLLPDRLLSCRKQPRRSSRPG